MDYKGQQLCEYIYYILTVIFGTASWLYGYIYSDFQLTFYGWLIGLAISVVLCIPDWPFYNRNKVIWFDEASAPVDTKKEPVSTSKGKSKKNKKE